MWAVFDLETTGRYAPARPPGIVEVAFAVFDDLLKDQPISQIVTKVDPEMPAEDWEEGAIKVHGIRPEDVASSPSFGEVAVDMAEMMVGCRHLVHYNGHAFDVPVLQHHLRAHGIDTSFPWPPRSVDVMMLAQDRIPDIEGKRGVKRPTLEEAHRAICGAGISDWHSAGADIAATWNILRAIKKGG